MSRLTVIAVLGVCLTSGIFARPLPGDQASNEGKPAPTKTGDGNETKVGKQDEKTGGKKNGKKSKQVKSKYARLPRYFGQLELSDDQRSEVYAVQEELGRKIDELLRQLDELKLERDDQLKGLLTTSQKRKLTSRQNAALAARIKQNK